MVTFIGVLVVALLAVVYAVYSRDMEYAYRRSSAGSRMAHTPCGPIEYAVAGEGPPLLVVHGAGGGFDQGLELAQGLVAAGYQVVAMSRFGYLRTPLPADASAAAQADAHACLLDALGIARVALIGASAGAPSALQFALRHPERVYALVLLVPAAYAPNRERTRPLLTPARKAVLQSILRSDFLYWAARRLAPSAMMRAVLATPPEVVARAGAGERARVREFLEHVAPLSARRAGLLNDAAVVAGLKHEDLARIAAPTLAISADDDLYGMLAGARYTTEHIPHARLIRYPSGGHLLAGHRAQAEAEIAAFVRGALPVDNSDK